MVSQPIACKSTSEKGKFSYYWLVFMTASLLCFLRHLRSFLLWGQQLDEAAFYLWNEQLEKRKKIQVITELLQMIFVICMFNSKKYFTMRRRVVETVAGKSAIDGAGVHLVRVLGQDTVKKFDPFLMLDAFDSHNPDDYITGFPMHPHRGIETFTYLMKGRIDHKDSLGNKGTIHNGESQWMTSGSGIMHQEMPQPTEHLLGLQLWINLPANEKMTEPKYFDISHEMIKEVKEEGVSVRVVAGKYKDQQGAKGHHVQVTVLDITADRDKDFSMKTNPEETLFVYIVDGEGQFGGGQEMLPNKIAVLFDSGDEFYVRAGVKGIHFILFSGKPLKEPIEWGGPIVMNTREELFMAFGELSDGTFIK